MGLVTRPLLASAVEDIDSIKYPQYCTPKFDGIRCLMVDGKAVSRKFKPQPNTFVRETLERLCVEGLDGELVLKNSAPAFGCDLTETNGIVVINFNDVQSAIMSFEGEPDFEFHVFDYVKDDLKKTYLERMRDLEDWFLRNRNAELENRIKLILPIRINSKEELLAYETKCLAEGFEGVMLRTPNGPYKCGRSTVREGTLLKMKRFEDSEATIIGFEERQHNTNEKEKNELGLSKRSTKKEGMVGADTLGALIVRDIKTNMEFSLGTGFDDAMRKEIWTNKEKYLNKLLKYKHQPSGALEKPRFPIWLGWRSEDDM